MEISQNYTGHHIKWITGGKPNIFRVSIMLKVKHRRTATLASDHLRNDVQRRIVNGEAMELAKIFTELLRLGVDLTARCDGKKTGSCKK